MTPALKKPPTVFLSYAWETESHQAWVKALATRLRTQDGIDANLDLWEAQPGDALTRFMEQNVRESEFILLICTPAYKDRFNQWLGGVGYKAKSITGHVLTGLADRKIVSIHKGGTWTEAAPTVMDGSDYLNLSLEPYSEAEYRALVDMLHGRRETAPPIRHGAIVFEGPGAAPVHAVPNFSGREEEMRTLISHLQAPTVEAVCVVSAGIGGVGKTALTRQLVATDAGSKLFPEGAVWLDGTRLLSELMRVCKRFGWLELNELTPEEAWRFLCGRLHDRALLLVVDNVSKEVDLTLIPIPGGKCRTLITSRLMNLGQQLGVPTATHCLQNWKSEDCRRYLRAEVPRLATESDPDLDALTGFVHGVPLGVRLIGKALLKAHSRSARQYLALLEAQPLGTLDRLASETDRGIAATFLEAYGSLLPDTQSVLQALAACASGTCSDIVAAVSGLSDFVAEEALNTLVDVSLAEYRPGSERPWELNSVVRLFVCAQAGRERVEAAHLAWVQGHLQFHSDSLTHAEREKGISEAVVALERLLAGKNYEQADEIYYPIFNLLLQYGRYAQGLDLTERRLSGHEIEVTPVVACYLGNLGCCYQALGELSKAIEFHKSALAMYEQVGSLQGQADSLGNLGLCYRPLGELSRAIEFHERALAMNKQLGNSEGQAVNLGPLGACYRTLGDISKAIEFHEGALAKYEQLGSLQEQATNLGDLGACFLKLGDVGKAIEFHERALAMYEQLGSLRGQAADLGNLGSCYHTLGDVGKAIEFYERATAMNEQLGNLRGQAADLGNLGCCYETLGDISKAIEFHERSLEMNMQLGSPEGQAANLGNLGLCYYTLGKISKPIEFHERALVINEQLGRLGGQAINIGALGCCYQRLGDISKAIEFHEWSLAIHERLGGLQGQAISVGNLRLCYQTLGDISKATEFHERAVKIHEQLDRMRPKPISS